MKGIYIVLLAFSVSVAVAQTKIDSLERALETAKGDLKVKTLNEFFRAYINSDPVKAIEYTRQALALATEIDDQKGMAASYNNLGVAYRNQGALDKSLEYYLISLQIYTKLDNKEGIAATKSNIGNIYSFKKDHGQAMKYYEDAHKHFMEIGDSSNLIRSLNNLGNLHNNVQEQEQALKYYTEAFQLAERKGQPFADPINNIGNIYFKQGNLQRAAEYYERTLKLARKENDNLLTLNVLSSLGEVYARAGQFKTAQAYLDSAMTMSGEMQAFIFSQTFLKAWLLIIPSKAK